MVIAILKVIEKGMLLLQNSYHKNSRHAGDNFLSAKIQFVISDRTVMKNSKDYLSSMESKELEK